MENLALDLHDLLQQKVLPRYFHKYVTKDYYPIIIGGSAVLRCMTMYPETRALVDDTFKSDIDVDFVLRAFSKRDIKRAAIAQDAFLHDIVNDVDFVDMINKSRVFECYLRPLQIPNKPLLRVVSLNIRNKVGTTNGGTAYITILDTVLFHEKEKVTHNFYKKYLKSTYPIPRETNGNILWGSCYWMFLDTVRMMYIYDYHLSHWREELPAKRKQFIFIKLHKYILKFCVLYVVMHEANQDSLNEVMVVYQQIMTRLNKALKRPNVLNTTTGVTIPKEDRQTIVNIVKKLLNISSEVQGFAQDLRKLYKSIPQDEM